MQVRSLINGGPRSLLVLGLPVFVLALVLSVACGGDDEESSNQAQAARTPERTATSSAPVVIPTAVSAPQPTATAVPEPVVEAPNRANCSAIAGTDYQSDAERDWFRANCTGTASAAAGSGGGSSGAGSTGGGGGSSSAVGNTRAPSSGATSGVESATGQRLVIPAAGVNAPITVTLMTGGQMPDPKGYFSALTYDMSGYTGLGGDVNFGNMVISGHVDCGTCNNGGVGTAIFWSVRQLGVGDTAQVITADGRTVSYRVKASGSYTANMDYTSFVASNAADMTIITCTGSFSGGEYDRRHVVQFTKV